MAANGANLTGAMRSTAVTQPEVIPLSRGLAAPAGSPPSQARRTRGPASRKFQRGPTNAAEHERRVEWGKTWGARIAAATRAWKLDQGIV